MSTSFFGSLPLLVAAPRGYLLLMDSEIGSNHKVTVQTHVSNTYVHKSTCPSECLYFVLTFLDSSKYHLNLLCRTHLIELFPLISWFERRPKCSQLLIDPVM